MPTVSSENQNLNSKTLKNLPREQKIAVIFLAIFSILVIVLWVVQLSTQINKPFSLGDKANRTNTATSTDQSMKDSDGDGLLDYEEANLYQTSPYLEDSDSDGILDKQEITQGSDPNCPAGQDCGSAEATANENNVSASSTVDILDFDSLGLDALNETAENSSSSGGISEVTPAMIRQELLNSGVEQAALDKISDEDLIKIYEESIAQQGATE